MKRKKINIVSACALWMKWSWTFPVLEAATYNMYMLVMCVCCLQCLYFSCVSTQKPICSSLPDMRQSRALLNEFLVVHENAYGDTQNTTHGAFITHVSVNATESVCQWSGLTNTIYIYIYIYGFYLSGLCVCICLRWDHTDAKIEERTRRICTDVLLLFSQKLCMHRSSNWQ